MRVRDVMTEDVVSVRPEMGVREFAELLVNKNISGAPVVNEDGQVLGIALEEGVIFQDKKVHLPTFINLSLGYLALGTKRYEDEIKKITASKVKDIMEKVFSPVNADMAIEDAATLMLEKGIFYLPVLEEEKLVGVITKKDIVRTIAKTSIR